MMSSMPEHKLIARTTISLVFIIVAFTLHQQAAAQALITDRPTQTTTSSVVTKGSLQLETGILNTSSTELDIKTSILTIPSVLLRYGLMDKLELRLASDINSVRVGNLESDFGMGDLSMGTKVNILQGHKIVPELGLVGGRKANKTRDNSCIILGPFRKNVTGL